MFSRLLVTNLARGVAVCAPSTKGVRLVTMIAQDNYQHNDYSNANNSYKQIAIGAGIFTAFGLVVATNKLIHGESIDYAAVRTEIKKLLEDENYDDGSYGPVFVRLAWHASGTYSILDKTGGSDGAKMRFHPESTHGCNAGLDIARNRLEIVKKKFPNISYADLWTLAGVVAIEEMGGPQIKWNPGRSDVADGTTTTPDGRLPDAARGHDHIRAIFYRMGLNDQEIVALAGAHALGRCHRSRSGFDGPWTRSPTTFSNEYFVQLVGNKWVKRNWDGPIQFENENGKDLMMLPADLALLEDPEFKKWVEIYAKDEDRFFKDFAAAFQKLEELGTKVNQSNQKFSFFGR